MKDLLRTLTRSAVLSLAGGVVALVPASSAVADNPAPPSDLAPVVAGNKEKSVPTYDLLTAAKQGLVSVKAEGLGDGRMSLSVHNRTKKELRVVLPPGLIASGVSGQFGGMGGGGMGGGRGGGGMGGGMGGMGGGGMGGGMGGMGGGMGGGGMGGGGGMSGGGTMPASMGMMTLGMLIMNLVGDRDSWNMSSLRMGMGGGMGGMGGGMGGGMRSVPPTGLPFADLKANQTRSLPTRLASLSAPTADGTVALPEKGERLQIGDLRTMKTDPRVLKALTRLALDKAPETLATLVLWNVASGLDWATIKEKSKGWANEHERSLAQSFVAQLDDLPQGDTGVLLYEIKGSGAATSTLAKELSSLLKDRPVLGLTAKLGIPQAPDSPAVACKIVVEGTSDKPAAIIFVANSDGSATSWVPTGKFTLPVALDGGKLKVAEFANALAEGLLDRLVRVQISKTGAMAKGKAVYKVRIDNASPLVLNGLAILGGGKTKTETTPKVISGISIPPRKSMSLPITGDMVDQFGLRKDVRVIAADLSGL